MRRQPMSQHDRRMRILPTLQTSRAQQTTGDGNIIKNSSPWLITMSEFSFRHSGRS